MLISWELLKLFIDIQPFLTPEEVAERLTFSGAEVESITHCAGKMKGVVAAKIIALDVHPTEHKYFVATLDTGAGRHLCVTSAKNMHVGDLVIYAGEGSILPDGSLMTTRNFAGVNSAGMMLSAEELGLHDVDDPSGLLILPHDALPGSDAKTLYHIGDTVLDVAITPNRGDLLSHLGVAREIAGLFPNSSLMTPHWLEPLFQSKPWSEHFGTISLPDKDCFAYRLGLATGAKIGPSPLTPRIDLAHLGMRPINNAVDVTNYVMLMIGQPLHAFDLNTLPAREITVRAAVDGEHMTTLDGKDRALTSRDMLITSGGQAIALAGVMGGQQTGINDDTSTIVIESASFSPIRVGHTSRRLAINSEAAFRFSRTVDTALNQYALWAASNLMREWCGANVDYRPLSAENDTPSPKPITLTKRKLSVYLSWTDFDRAAKILDGFGIHQVNEGQFLPPTWRPDITIEEDLIEEIGRFLGYNDVADKLPGEMPKRADIGDAMRLGRHGREFMMARGFSEILTYSFLPEDFTQTLRLADNRAKPIIIANPISQAQSAMRTTLLPGLLAALKTTVNSGWREFVRVFEQGRVFINDTEPEHLAALLFNGTDNRSPNNDRSEGFYDLKSDVDALIRSRGVVPAFRAGSEPFMHSGQCADVLIGGRKVGYLGRVKPVVEQDLGVSGVYVFELDLGSLIAEVKPVFKAVSEFPASLRDISLLVPVSVSNDDVVRDIHECVSGLEAEVRLFDVYEGQGIPEGYRSLAYTLSYRAGRTLRDEEVEGVHVGLREGLAQRGYILR